MPGVNISAVQPLCLKDLRQISHSDIFKTNSVIAVELMVINNLFFGEYWAFYYFVVCIMHNDNIIMHNDNIIMIIMIICVFPASQLSLVNISGFELSDIYYTIKLTLCINRHKTLYIVKLTPNTVGYSKKWSSTILMNRS